VASPSASLQLASLDTTDGLNRCMGNLDLYRRLLKGFARTQRDFAQQMSAAMPTVGQTDDAIALVHTLKGLAGNIGARTLLERTTVLEAELRSPTTGDQAATPSVKTALDATLAALDAVLADIDRMGRPSSEPVWGNGPDQEVLQGHWTHLGRLVGDQDAQARELLQELLGTWPSLRQHPQVTALKQALDRYDFDNARDVLAQVQG